MSLSEHQQRVVDMVLDGKSNEEIADALGIKIKTVKFHLTNIYAEECVLGRAQLIVKKFRERSINISNEEIKAFREILK